MAKMNPYLNFDGNAFEAFTFYKSVFGGEFITVMTMKDAPDPSKFSEDELNRVMHIALPIDTNTVLMASDTVPSMGQTLEKGNNVYICLNATSREEADRLFDALSDGGKVEMAMDDMFWGAYYGTCIDKYDIHWMINFDKNRP